MKPLIDIVILGSKPIKGMKSKGPLSSVQMNKSQTILDNQIKNLHKKININNIFYVGSGANLVNDKSSNKVVFIDNKDYASTNNTHSLRLALQKSTAKSVIVLFHKIVFSHEIFNFFNFNESQILISKSEEYPIGCTICDNKILNLFYNLQNRCCGIYYVTNLELFYLKKLLDTEHHDNKFIFELINKTISMGGRYKPRYLLSKKSIYIIHNNKTLNKFKKYYGKNFNA